MVHGYEVEGGVVRADPQTREREGLSVRGLARRFKTHRRTVREALASPVLPPRKPSPARLSPVLDPWKADHRRLAGRVPGRSQEATSHRPAHLAALGRGARCRCRRVDGAALRGRGPRRQPMALREVTVPQHHPLGEEAEVDFGSISFYLNGLFTEG